MPICRREISSQAESTLDYCVTAPECSHSAAEAEAEKQAAAAAEASATDDSSVDPDEELEVAEEPLRE